MTKAKANIKNLKTSVKEEVKEEKKEMVGTEKPKEMAITKSVIQNLVRQNTQNTQKPGITALISALPDDDFWEKLSSRMPWPELFSGKVKVRWVQTKENEAPEIAFVSENMPSILGAVLEEIVSLSVFHQTIAMKMRNSQLPVSNPELVIHLLSRLYVLLSISWDFLLQQEQQRMMAQADEAKQAE